MHRLVEAQALDIWPFEDVGALLRKLANVV